MYNASGLSISQACNNALHTKKCSEVDDKGRTVLIMKDPEKGTSLGNYRPITYLPVIWKMLTGIISEEIYLYLDREDLLPEEQKGCRRGSWGTNDQLFIDKGLLRESKARNKNLAMCWT